MIKAVVALAVAMLVASPVYAAKPVSCPKGNPTILAVINQSHSRVPDLQVMETHAPDAVARGAKIINDAPPPTHFKGDQLYFMMSPSQPTAYMILTDHGCALGNLQVPVQELPALLKKVLKGDDLSL